MGVYGLDTLAYVSLLLFIIFNLEYNISSNFPTMHNHTYSIYEHTWYQKVHLIHGWSHMFYCMFVNQQNPNSRIRHTCMHVLMRGHMPVILLSRYILLLRIWSKKMHTIGLFNSKPYYLMHDHKYSSLQKGMIRVNIEIPHLLSFIINYQKF